MPKQKVSVRLVLLSLMLSTFAIGTTEYVVMGFLTQIADTFDVSIASTGLLVTIYAISVAVFGPLLTMITVKWPRKPLLIMLIILFIVSNIGSAVAPTFNLLLATRVTAGIMHASFFGVAMVVAAKVVSPTKQGLAISSVQGGLTIALMLGVPFGSLIGGMLSWRLIFWLIALLGLISLMGIIRFVPNIKLDESPSLKKEIISFKNKEVLFALATIIFGYAGVFTTYTFIEPMLREITNYGVNGVTAALFSFGLGAAIGNFLSGRIPMNYLTSGLIFSLSGLAVVLAIFTFLIQNPISALIIVFLFGLGAFGTIPILQTKMITGAKEAPTLAATTAASAFNVANAVGAWLGGVLLSNGFSFLVISLAGALITIIGLIITLFSKYTVKQ